MKKLFLNLSAENVWVGLGALLSIIIILIFLKAVAESGVVMHGAGIGGMSEY